MSLTTSRYGILPSTYAVIEPSTRNTTVVVVQSNLQHEQVLNNVDSVLSRLFLGVLQYNCFKVLHFIMSLYESFLLIFINFNLLKFLYLINS